MLILFMVCIGFMVFTQEIQATTKNTVKTCKVNISVESYTSETPLRNQCEIGVNFYTKIDKTGIHIYRQIGSERKEIGWKGEFILRDKRTSERMKIDYQVTDRKTYLEKIKKTYKGNKQVQADIEAITLLIEKRERQLKKQEKETAEKREKKLREATLKKQEKEIEKELQTMQRKKRAVGRYSVDELKVLQKQGKLEFTDIGSYVYEVRVKDKNFAQEIDKQTAEELGYVDSKGEVLAQEKKGEKKSQEKQSEEKGMKQSTKNILSVIVILAFILGTITLLTRKIEKV